jgi:hypothetical protein
MMVPYTKLREFEKRAKNISLLKIKCKSEKNKMVFIHSLLLIMVKIIFAKTLNICFIVT